VDSTYFQTYERYQAFKKAVADPTTLPSVVFQTLRPRSQSNRPIGLSALQSPVLRQSDWFSAFRILVVLPIVAAKSFSAATLPHPAIGSHPAVETFTQQDRGMLAVPCSVYFKPVCKPQNGPFFEWATDKLKADR
jgi:hypothetical protein